MTSFDGFPSDAWAFLAELEADNTKAFFDANRTRYEASVAGPSKALVDAVGNALRDRVTLDVRAEAKVGRSLFRVNRDTRFSADKTPYKTHLDFLFWVGDGAPRERPAFIARITASTVLVGGGRMGLRGTALDAYRRALDDPGQGGSIRAAVHELIAGGAELSDPDRARPPRPYAADHPSAELLRRDGFHVSRTIPHPNQLATQAGPAWLAEAMCPHASVVEWFGSIG